jgi:hypothetical protein
MTEQSRQRDRLGKRQRRALERTRRDRFAQLFKSRVLRGGNMDTAGLVRTFRIPEILACMVANARMAETGP